jgi:DNA-binding LytR/AlgR family response regulator
MKVLIIEDELPAANELAMMLKDIQNDIFVNGIIQSVEEAIHWMKTQPAPDLIFCDVELGDGSGFEIFREIPVSRPVVFCTAYDEYALEAFQNNGIDYLLKPINPEHLKNSFKKLENLSHLFRINSNGDYFKRLNNLINHTDLSYRNTLLSHYKGKVVPIPVSKIKYIQAKNNAVFAYANDGMYKINESMGQLIEELDPVHFYRISRQYIICREAIKDIRRLPGGRLAVSLDVPDMATVTVSRAQTDGFMKWADDLLAG